MYSTGRKGRFAEPEPIPEEVAEGHREAALDCLESFRTVLPAYDRSRWKRIDDLEPLFGTDRFRELVGSGEGD